jgi:prolipoprotein diacylglyceryltransferase
MILLRAYATIPEFFNALFNTTAFPNIPFNTYGFFVAMGFFVAAIASSFELKRRGNLGMIASIPTTEIIGAKPKWQDFIFPVFVGFFMGMKILGALIHNKSLLTNGQNTVSYLFSSEGFPVYGFVVAILAAAYTYYTINKAALPESKLVKVDLEPQDLIGELVFVAAIFGVIGASMFELIQPKSNMTLIELFSDPMNFLSGLTIYGGLTFGIIGISMYAFYRKLKPFMLFDSLAPGFILAMAFGRMGCHFSGDGDWGIVNTAPAPSWLPEYFWSNNYAHNVLNEGERIVGCVGNYCHQLVPGVYPTATYEILMFLVLFLIMWSVRKKVTHLPGFMFMMLFVVSGIERFPIEMIRVTDRFPSFFNLSQAQIISVCMVLVGAAGMLYLTIKSKKAKA